MSLARPRAAGLTVALVVFTVLVAGLTGPARGEAAGSPGPKPTVRT